MSSAKNNNIDTSFGLIRFDPPVPASMVRKPKNLKLKPAPPPPPAASRIMTSSSSLHEGRSSSSSMQPPIEDILASIVPPKIVGHQQQQPNQSSSASASNSSNSSSHQQQQQQLSTPLVQCVSTIPASRLDVIRLQEQLDTLLMQRQARDAGICAVRSELFSKVFDELIRQVTINCPERGLILLRVRDELRLTQEAYRALYESSIEYGARNQALFTHANEEKGVDSVPAEQHQRLHQLREQKKMLELKVIELQRKAEQIETEEAQKRRQADLAHAETINFYMKTQQQLAKQLSAETQRAGGRK